MRRIRVKFKPKKAIKFSEKKMRIRLNSSSKFNG